jgi:hypothetical protein
MCVRLGDGLVQKVLRLENVAYACVFRKWVQGCMLFKTWSKHEA